MPRMGFEPTTPVFKWSKTVHALDRAVTVIGPGITNYTSSKYLSHEEPHFPSISLSVKKISTTFISSF
jgi:hypothetical protein